MTIIYVFLCHIRHLKIAEPVNKLSTIIPKINFFPIFGRNQKKQKSLQIKAQNEFHQIECYNDPIK